MEVGLLTALLGGVLSLLSPCGAFLIPGFLATAATRRGGLLLHAGVFYLGLLLALVPLGLGLGALGALAAVHRDLLIGGTALLLVVMGAVHALGGGFDLSRLLPGGTALRERITGTSGMVRTLLLGAVGGIAGFCAGPILGAVLSLAFGQGSALAGAVLLAVYGLGMVLPLPLLVTAADTVGRRRAGSGAGGGTVDGEPRSTFRGAGSSSAAGSGGRRVVRVLIGAVIIGLGVLFWFTNGLVTLPSLVPTETLHRWQVASAALNDTALQIVIILLLGAAALAAWGIHDRRRRSAASAGPFDLRPRPGLPGASGPPDGRSADDDTTARTREGAAPTPRRTS